jgi:hypothetical protein
MFALTSMTTITITDVADVVVDVDVAWATKIPIKVWAASEMGCAKNSIAALIVVVVNASDDGASSAAAKCCVVRVDSFDDGVVGGLGEASSFIITVITVSVGVVSVLVSGDGFGFGMGWAEDAGYCCCCCYRKEERFNSVMTGTDSTIIADREYYTSLILVTFARATYQLLKLNLNAD